MKDDYIANLGFLLDYNEGTTNDEIEYELFKIAFQVKGSVHYDRVIGGDFENLEQEPSVDALSALPLRFSASMVESVYRLNEEKSFNPYIVVGFADISTAIEDTTYYVELKYRLLKDLIKEGKIKMEI